jgi:general stress protein CsbA
MNLSAPKNVTFYVAVVLGLLGLLGAIIPLGFVTSLSFWLVLVGFVVLAAGNLMSNL